MKNIYLLLLLLATSFTSFGQTAYTVSNITCVPALEGTGTDISILDDRFSQRIPVGFDFCFYGQTHDTLLVGSNGCVSFNLANAGGANPFSVPAAGNFGGISQTLFNGILMPLTDLNPGVGGHIRYFTDGMAPYRRFVLEYENVPYFGNNVPDSTFYGQLVLAETYNTIEIHLVSRPKRNINTFQSGLMALLPPYNAQNPTGLTLNNYWGLWAAHRKAFRFTPYGGCGNGEANLARGKVFFDLDFDCVQSQNETGLAGQLVLANGGDYFTYTDGNGEFAMALDSGSFVIEHIPMTLHENLCPGAGSYVVNFQGLGLLADSLDFADTARICADLTVDIGASWNRRCRQNSVHVDYGNHGTSASQPSTITVVLPDSTYFVSSNPAPDVVIGNTLTYYIAALQPNANGTISIVDSVDCNVTMGLMMHWTADITQDPDDCDSTNNQSSHYAPVVASWDPNDLTALSIRMPEVYGFLTEEDIEATTELTYMVRFQNTGNDTAFNVRIEDMLPAELDAATVLPGASSHPYTFFRYGHDIRFYFNNIMLPYLAVDSVGCNGFVRFNVAQVPFNNNGTQIINMANIYFDMNPAIPTNNTIHTIPFVTGTNAPIQNVGLNVYPNPSTERAVVEIISTQVATGQEFVRVFDLLGNQVAQYQMNNGRCTVETAQLAPGMYVIKLEDGKGTLASEKIIVR